jgi:hypothetical protein
MISNLFFPLVPFYFRLINLEDWIVLLGAHELSGSRNDAQQSIKVAKIKIHENYNPKHLVRIVTSLAASKYISRAILSPVLVANEFDFLRSLNGDAGVVFLDGPPPLVRFENHVTA